MRVCLFFFVKQNTAYEMRISDWSSDVCSSDLPASCQGARVEGRPRLPARACRWPGGPQLWPCRRQAGGPAPAGGRAGEGGVDAAGGGPPGARRPCRRARRVAAVCRAGEGDRKSVVSRKSVHVRVDTAGLRVINTKTTHK